MTKSTFQSLKCLTFDFIVNPCTGTMTGGRLYTCKTIGKMIQNLRNGYQLVSIPPHGLTVICVTILSKPSYIVYSIKILHFKFYLNGVQYYDKVMKPTIFRYSPVHVTFIRISFSSTGKFQNFFGNFTTENYVHRPVWCYHSSIFIQVCSKI